MPKVAEQISCLEQEEGAGVRYMGYLDLFSPKVRKRIRESPFNLCLACIGSRAYDYRWSSNLSREDAEFAAIFAMEQEIKNGSLR